MLTLGVLLSTFKVFPEVMHIQGIMFILESKVMDIPFLLQTLMQSVNLFSELM